MKVDSPFFNQPVSPSAGAVRPAAEQSEARKAFAALLTATAQRGSVPQPRASQQGQVQERVVDSRSGPSAPTQGGEPATPAALARPGRVLDIRV